VAFCLDKKESEKFLSALRSGKLDPPKMLDLSSAQRRAIFEKLIGKENAQEVNAQFEAKILLKDQKRGLVSWAKKLTGISEQTRRDLIAKIEKMEKILEPETERAFLEDLVAKKLGADVTLEEAKNIATGIKEVVRLKEAIPENSPIRSKERIEYGLAEVLFRDYIDALKQKDTRSLPAKIKEFITSPSKVVFELAGATKSVLASLDNSFQLRQGIKMLFSVVNADIWAKGFLSSWKVIGKTLVGVDAKTPIKADVFSRPNALNGKYRAAKVDLGIIFEEAFPSSLPERIPLLGRFFKASEAAYSSTALRLRADYADRMIAKAEKQGIDTLNTVEALPIGKLVNSMTGRGGIGKLEVVGKELNVALFSIKFIKANIDFLTAHLLDKNMSAFARKQAATNLATSIATISAVLWTANQLWPDSVDTDTRGADAGKIRIGDTRFDISGGMASIIALASRITPTMHDGEWGFWKKSSTPKKVYRLNSGKFYLLQNPHSPSCIVG